MTSGDPRPFLCISFTIPSLSEMSVGLIFMEFIEKSVTLDGSWIALISAPESHPIHPTSLQETVFSVGLHVS